MNTVWESEEPSAKRLGRILLLGDKQQPRAHFPASQLHAEALTLMPDSRHRLKCENQHPGQPLGSDGLQQWASEMHTWNPIKSPHTFLHCTIASKSMSSASQNGMLIAVHLSGICKDVTVITRLLGC